MEYDFDRNIKKHATKLKQSEENYSRCDLR